jgi:hypothetical protein
MESRSRRGSIGRRIECNNFVFLVDKVRHESKSSPKFMRRQYFRRETVITIAWVDDVMFGHAISICHEDIFKGMTYSLSEDLIKG